MRIMAGMTPVLASAESELEMGALEQKERVASEAIGLSGMVDAERAIADYLVQAGIVPEKGINDEEKAKLVQRKRQENYQNVECLLKQARSIRRVKAIFDEDIRMRLEEETTTITNEELLSGSAGLFDALAKRLEIMELEDERKFLRVYAPQIAVGKRYELALTSLNLGMKVLKGEDPESWQLLNTYYIEGDQMPSIREMLRMFNIQSTSSYYNKMEQARRRLTNYIFGYSSNKATLSSILVFIRQQVEDDYFPEKLD